MKTNIKKLAIFDWNGTLIDDAHANWQSANVCLESYGRPQISFDDYRATMDFPLTHFYMKHGIHPDEYLSRFQEVGIKFIDKYKELARDVLLTNGATDLFDWLLDNDYDLMILSNFVQHEPESQISHYQISHYFTHICGNLAFNEIEHSRTTKHDRLLNILNQSDYDLNNSFIIGDSLEEPEIAHHLGFKCFSVSWGCLSPERLSKVNPDFMIDTLAQIPEILQKRS